MGDEAFHSEAVSQLPADMPCFSSGNSSNISPSGSSPMLMVPDSEDSDFSLFGAGPASFKEAISKMEWRCTMEEEVMAIRKNGTWDLVHPLDRKNVIGLK